MNDSTNHVDRPVRFDDPARNAAYWERVRRNVASAPPLTTEQIATLRGIFHRPPMPH